MRNIHNFKTNCFFSQDLVLSSIAVLFGGLIYIFFRPLEPVFFAWIEYFDFEEWLAATRQNTLLLTHLLPDWILYSLPHGLWTFAYSLLITGIWWRNKSHVKYFWLASIPLLIVGWEVFQYLGILPGTFSFEDITLGLAGICTGIFTGIKLSKLNNYEKGTNE